MNNLKVDNRVLLDNYNRLMSHKKSYCKYWGIVLPYSTRFHFVFTKSILKRGPPLVYFFFNIFFYIYILILFLLNISHIIFYIYIFTFYKLNTTTYG